MIQRRPADTRVQVSGDPCGLSFGDLDEPPQEPTCGMPVAALAQHRVDEITTMVDRPVR